MSATIPESMRLDDLLKATGYDCPAELQGKTFDQATEGGGGGDVPTEWYLWIDDGGHFCYLPFATAPDTLDSLKLVFIGKKLEKDTEIETYGVAEYTKNSDTEFFFTDDEPNPSSSTFARMTVDVPIGGAVEPNKEVTITENGVKVIRPSQFKDFGYDSMAQVTVTVNVSGASFFEEINLNTDNPTYNKTLTKGASIYLNKYVNMLVGRGDVTETVTSIGEVFATVTYVDSTRVLTVALNTSHPEASDGVSFKVWGE